ncbi:hypothetical protein ACFQGE_14015 [Halomicroarcula sp. GCM10025817]|uniref:hypothetical protein n=1 Tax=Haloarcula TaxID=2237 RepID=UPI0023E7B07B|nr:hypothetical protein [Halomicroarcula sp. SYNS111]
MGLINGAISETKRSLSVVLNELIVLIALGIFFAIVKVAVVVTGLVVLLVGFVVELVAASLGGVLYSLGTLLMVSSAMFSGIAAFEAFRTELAQSASDREFLPPRQRIPQNPIVLFLVPLAVAGATAVAAPGLLFETGTLAYVVTGYVCLSVLYRANAVCAGYGDRQSSFLSDPPPYRGALLEWGAPLTQIATGIGVAVVLLGVEGALFDFVWAAIARQLVAWARTLPLVSGAAVDALWLAGGLAIVVLLYWLAYAFFPQLRTARQTLVELGALGLALLAALYVRVRAFAAHVFLLHPR